MDDRIRLDRAMVIGAVRRRAVGFEKHCRAILDDGLGRACSHLETTDIEEAGVKML